MVSTGLLSGLPLGKEIPLNLSDFVAVQKPDIGGESHWLFPNRCRDNWRFSSMLTLSHIHQLFNKGYLDLSLPSLRRQQTRGLTTLSHNSRFTRLCKHLQLNRDKLYELTPTTAEAMHVLGADGLSLTLKFSAWPLLESA
jgi:hypothetical protein